MIALYVAIVYAVVIAICWLISEKDKKELYEDTYKSQ